MEAGVRTEAGGRSSEAGGRGAGRSRGGSTDACVVLSAGHERSPTEFVFHVGTMSYVVLGYWFTYLVRDESHLSLKSAEAAEWHAEPRTYNQTVVE